VRNASVAERVSYLLEPKNWIIVTTLAVGWHADGAQGLGWGAVAALFAGPGRARAAHRHRTERVGPARRAGAG